MTSIGEHVGPGAAPADAGTLVAAAAVLGDRFAREAVWHGGRCTWLGDAVEPVGAEWRVVHRSAGGDLYEGTAGIALFLSRLWERTGDPAHLEAALGAIRHSLAWVDRTADRSLFGGTAGLACAAAEAGERLGRPELVERARELAGALPDAPPPGMGFDLVAGVAGVVVALVDLAARLERPGLLERASTLGEGLIRRSRDDGVGLSWGEGEAEPGLCGLAHGASGPALAFVELFAATGDHRFADAAAAASRYERSWFSREQGNWPDLRELSRAAVTGGARPSYSTFWCHGGPGIGLARLREFQATGSTVALADAGAALQSAVLWREAVDVQGGGFEGNVSVCHGVATVAELFATADDVLGDPGYRRMAAALLEEAIAAHDGGRVPWRCGVVGGGETFGLMLGLAGLGAVLLHAAAGRGADPVGVIGRARPGVSSG